MGVDVLAIVTCTNRKTVAPPSALTVRTLGPGTATARAKAWLKKVQRSGTDLVTAESLYCGDHWQVVRSLTSAAYQRRHRMRIYVCSAGYGLVPLSAPLHPYAATFSPNHPDSVSQGRSGQHPGAARAEAVAWWNALSEWEGPAPGKARTLDALAREHKDSAILIAASPQYLDAMTGDFARLDEAGRERLTIFSAGAQVGHFLSDHLIPADARLQEVLGGALVSLNVRCMRYALEHRGSLRGRAATSRLFSTLLEGRIRPTRHAKESLQDDAVESYIRHALAGDPGLRPTPMLRRLRDGGRACEDARFGAIYRRVRGSSGEEEGGDG